MFLLQSQAVDVNVVGHPMQRFAVWFGGSLLASTPDFYNVLLTLPPAVLVICKSFAAIPFYTTLQIDAFQTWAKFDYFRGFHILCRVVCLLWNSTNGTSDFVLSDYYAGLPHQSRIRGIWIEYLPSKSCVQGHVLMPHLLGLDDPCSLVLYKEGFFFPSYPDCLFILSKNTLKCLSQWLLELVQGPQWTCSVGSNRHTGFW